MGKRKIRPLKLFRRAVAFGLRNAPIPVPFIRGIAANAIEPKEVKEVMLQQGIALLIEFMFSRFDAQFIRELIDDMLDKLEEKAAGTGTPIDDAILVAIRGVLQIPDDIGGDED